MAVKKTGTGGGGVQKDKVSANIMSVEILDISGNAVLKNQNIYVNIPNGNKYVDGSTIYSNSLVGCVLKCRVKFNRPGNHKFGINLKPDTSNNVYTSGEKTRNTNFKYQNEELSFTTDSDGTKIVNDSRLVVSSAGGDIFSLTATDDLNKTVSAVAKVRTMRRMYYVELKMQGLSSVASSLNRFTDEYKKHHILFSNLPAVEIPYMKNIGINEQTTFETNAKTKYNSSQGPSKKPYCIAVAYTGHLAVKDSNQRIIVSNVQGRTSTLVKIQIRHALWNNIVTGEDWYVGCYFIKNGGNPATDKIPIPKTKCTAVQKAGYPVGYFDSVNIDVSVLPSVRGAIVLTVNWVNRMRGGISLSGTNIVAICTKAWWKTVPADEQNDVIVHEVGHKLGMVTNGQGLLPDKTATFYDNPKGHKGNHCHYGIPAGQARYDSDADSKLSKCVMYGATNNHADFCPNCAKAVKKLDLSKGVK